MSLSDFQIIKQIGKGAFGIVYLVRRNKDKKIYALKQVPIGKMNNKERTNSLNEIRILSSINHRNIISYKECFFDDKTQSLNLVMEYADDGDLLEKIQRLLKAKLYFHEEEIWFIFIQMVQGLKALHNMKIMHRDLKSANIFLMKNGLIKLGDMNVSKVAKMDLLQTQTGTPYYASPEVWSRQSYDYKSDIWSIGCILYELCCLSLPFLGKKIEVVYSNVMQANYKRIPPCYSQDLEDMIDLILEVNPEKRFDCNSILDHPFVQKRYNSLGIDVIDKDFELDKANNKLIDTIHIKAINDLKKVLPKGKKYNNIQQIKSTHNNNHHRHRIKRPESSNIESSKKCKITRSNSQVNKRNSNVHAYKIQKATIENTTSRHNRSKTPFKDDNNRNNHGNLKVKPNSNLSLVVIKTNNQIPIKLHPIQCNKYNTPRMSQMQINSIQTTNPNSKCSNRKSIQTISRKLKIEEIKEASTDGTEELSHMLLENQNIDLHNIIEKISIDSNKINKRPKSCGIRKLPHCIDPTKQLLINPIKIVERHNLKPFIPSHMQIKLNTMYMFK